MDFFRVLGNLYKIIIIKNVYISRFGCNSSDRVAETFELYYK